MKITLFDRSEIIVSQAQGNKLKASLQKNPDGYIDINGTLVKKSGILKIEPGGYSEADMPKPNNPNLRLKSDNRSEDEQFKAARKASDIARKRLREKGLIK